MLGQALQLVRLGTTMNQTVTDYNELGRATSRATVSKYHQLSTVTILVLDYFITFSQEVELVWKTRWTFAKGLYLASRYISFSFVITIIGDFLIRPSRSSCISLNMFTIWTTWFAFGLGQAIFFLRTYAIWQRARWTLILLLVTYTVSMGIQLGINAKMTLEMFSAPTNSFGSNCRTIKARPALAFIDLASILFYETVVGCLTIMKALRDLRGTKSSFTPLLTVLYRDGLLFYVCNAGLSLTNILVNALAPKSLFNLVFCLQRVLHSIFSVRVILHIRQVSRETMKLDTQSMGISNSALVVQNNHTGKDIEIDII